MPLWLQWLHWWNLSATCTVYQASSLSLHACRAVLYVFSMALIANCSYNNWTTVYLTVYMYMYIVQWIILPSAINSEIFNDSKTLIASFASSKWPNSGCKFIWITVFFSFPQERHKALEEMGISVQSSGIAVEKSKFYLVNLNADPSMNELLVYYLKVSLQNWLPLSTKFPVSAVV